MRIRRVLGRLTVLTFSYSSFHIFSTGMSTEILPAFQGSEYAEVCGFS